MSQHSLEQAVQRAGIDAPPVWFDETASTNDEALVLAARGAPSWTVIATGHQTAGRGRERRTWHSVPGKLLQFTLLLRPPLHPAEASLTSLLAAAEMARACREVAGVAVRSKWPNDLLAGRRKVGGILTEARVQGEELEVLFLGVGVNVAQAEEDFPAELAEVATSLAIEGSPAEPLELLAGFLHGFRAAWAPGSAGHGRRIVSAYREICDTIGRRVRATTVDGRVVEGLAERIDDRGGLVVDGRTVSFGEIAHVG
ncbi:MAG TPA: biotin--[acetyl-CoA-carboxylase] ligase [Actinomycetota bacterium]|nr:biotin--[acetyl-CoA-carboxylase] ligase [Actinomycetota bacterium]